MGVESRNMSEQGVQAISTRLAQDEQLRMPGNLTRAGAAPDKAKREEYLCNLLRRDPGVFLERYAEQLTVDERAYFEPLREDYEVNFYLKQAEQQASAAKPTSAQVKNRRLAQMNRLDAAGEYFSDEAMRKRGPLLHHQYIGQYQAPAIRAARTNKLSDSILQQHDELQTQLRMAQQREAEDMVEEESDSDESEPEAAPRASGAGQPQSNQEEFLEIMRAKFLAGQDGEFVDYATVDRDSTLDDDWLAQQRQDAEDAYFETV
ncbi:hypothetical protein WJX72_006847 [[Myrmecia] bisecta]|uniref:CCD97-like C-terminal domain-containing protein n=1 Tax=[Myrmecia] bisecta TaxID=41462 RepID=A0AAW1Q7I1_9CHLO